MANSERAAFLKAAIDAHGFGMAFPKKELLSQSDGVELREPLEHLSSLVVSNTWWIGDCMTSGDLAVVSQASMLYVRSS